MGRGRKKKKQTDSLRHLTFVSCNSFLIFSVTFEDLNFFIMSIWFRWVFMPHYIGPSLRSFCLLKVAHLFDCVSLTVLLGLLGDLGSALSVISLAILSSLLSLLPSSQLGHIVQLALRDLPLLFLLSSFPPLLIGLLLSFPSPLSLTLFSLLSSLFFLLLLPFFGASLGILFSSLFGLLFLSALSLPPFPFALLFLLAPSSPAFHYPSLPPSPLPSCVPPESSLWHIAQLAPFFSLSPSLFPFGSAWAYCPVHP